MSIEERLKRLQEQIKEIEEEGRVAKACTWIQKFYVPKKNGKKYVYYRVMKLEEGKVKMVKYLGKKNSAKYLNEKAAISRRNRIQLIQRIYKKLEKEQRIKIAKITTNLLLQKCKLTNEDKNDIINELSEHFFPKQIQFMEKQLREFQELVERILTSIESGRLPVMNTEQLIM